MHIPETSWSSCFVIFHYYTINYFTITTKVALQWILSTLPAKSTDEELAKWRKESGRSKFSLGHFCFVIIKCHIIKKIKMYIREKSNIALSDVIKITKTNPFSSSSTSTPGFIRILPRWDWILNEFSGQLSSEKWDLKTCWWAFSVFHTRWIFLFTIYFRFNLHLSLS